MAVLLCIETATNVCSVALGREGKIIAEKVAPTGQNHAKMLTVLIEELFAASQSKMADLDAVAISQGPGSYTGLRIGTSVAKGICYALNIPLIAVNTLQALANFSSSDTTALRCAMIDARRMEVYTQLFDKELNPLTEIEAKILDENSFEDELAKQKINFSGDGVAKFAEICQSPNATFKTEEICSAKKMLPLAEKAFTKEDFVDVAYFTPFYLKKYQVTTSKKRLF